MKAPGAVAFMEPLRCGGMESYGKRDSAVNNILCGLQEPALNLGLKGTVGHKHMNQFINSTRQN